MDRKLYFQGMPLLNYKRKESGKGAEWDLVLFSSVSLFLWLYKTLLSIGYSSLFWIEKKSRYIRRDLSLSLSLSMVLSLISIWVSDDDLLDPFVVVLCDGFWSHLFLHWSWPCSLVRKMGVGCFGLISKWALQLLCKAYGNQRSDKPNLGPLDCLNIWKKRLDIHGF